VTFKQSEYDGIVEMFSEFNVNRRELRCREKPGFNDAFFGDLGELPGLREALRLDAKVRQSVRVGTRVAGTLLILGSPRRVVWR